MKKKLVLLGLILVSAIITGLKIIPENPKQTSPSPTSIIPPPNVFLIGAIQMEKDPEYYVKCDELKFNIWHNYVQINDLININGKTRRVPDGWYTFMKTSCLNDKLMNNVSDYANDVNAVITGNKNHNYRSFIERPKIEYLIRGQQSVYQCENVSNITSEKFYCFDGTETGRDIQDTEDGVNFMVKKCEPGIDPANSYVVYNVHSKYEQTACKGANELFLDNQYFWYVKPKIRIPQGLDDETLVCEIEVYDFNGTRRLDEIIKAKYFKENLQYDGKYKEVYPGTNSGFLKVDGEDLKPSDCGHSDNGSQFDIRVKWLGQCEMWIDYVKMESDVAEQIFRSTDNSDPWITGEANLIGTTEGAYRFWVEEPDYNCLPCVKYVQDKMINNPIPSPNPTAKLLMNDYSCYQAPWGTEVTGYDEYKAKYNSMNMSEIVSMCFFFKLKDTISDEIQTSPYNIGNGFLGTPVSKELYEYVMQKKYDRDLIGWQKKYAIRYAKEYPDKPFYFGVTTMLNYYPILGFAPQGGREPTNQEIETIANIMITYGIKGIMYHCYDGFGELPQTSPPFSTYGRGLTEPPDINHPEIRKRLLNVYGQQKWDYIKTYNEKLAIWGPYLIQFNNALSKSYRYHKVLPENSIDERTELITTSYIKHLYAFPNGDPMICPEININNDYPDISDDTYAQVGIFKKSGSDVDKYFMVVNRRSNPGIDPCSGYRRIEVDMGGENNFLEGHNSWKIINLYDNTTVAQFNSTSINRINLGWFNAGEGKLFKITPVTLSGGTLTADEILSGNINCKGKIYNNGYSITLNPGTTLTFTDTAGIEMNGGSFICGVNADNADAVTLQKSTNGTGWCGLSLNNCTSVGIYNTFINGIKANDTAKSVSMTNCFNANFRRNTFSQTNNSGAIQVVYTNPSDETLTLNIRECNFNMGQSGYSGINIISNASMTTPAIIEWCTFNTSNDTSNAIMLTNVTGGALKNNSIIGFKKSVVALSSTIDIFGNRIIGCNSSNGIQCLSGSDVTMKTVSGYHLGGENYIRNYGNSSACIYSDNSWFNISRGENHFDLDDIDNSKFLTGTLSGTPVDNVDATKNCFHKDSVQNIEGNQSMTWSENHNYNPVGYSFSPYTCDLSQNENFFVFNYGGYNDTIYYNPGGQGSGFNPKKVMNIQEGGYRSLRDTINLNLRKRNYSVVEDKAKQLLTQYPDSLESIGMIQKLYIASLTLDQNGNKIGQLKTYLENLISSNSQNPALIKRAFYHIQKCKVKLGQYQSALDGFQYIMTQNPYSYEGLVASWDYAATYLLMGQGGSISGETEQMTEELITPADTLLNRMSRNDSKTKTVSDGQKTKIFYEKVKIATKDDKTVQEEKIKQLEKTIESSKSDITKSNARTELTTMKTIKESVKIKKPNSVKTHVIMINDDIKKIFGIGKGSKTSNANNLIPKTYELYQNYPNPFNPSTKIAFDLPQDAKVKLVIYDILGRQIKTLVDNELRTAGKYTIEFNGSNLASGVYFYQLSINSEQLAIKKMVLLK